MSRLPESMRHTLEEFNARMPLDHVRNFLRGHFSAAQDLDEVLRDLRNVASFSTLGLQRDLEALEIITTASLPDGVLAQLVGWDGNWVLEDPSDEGAKAFLHEVASMLRHVTAQAPAAPRQSRRNGG